MRSIRHYEARLRWSHRLPYVIARRLLIAAPLLAILLAFFVVIVRSG